MDCSPPGSSVHKIFQARILSGLPFPAAGDLPDPGIEPSTPALASGFFTTEPPGKPMIKYRNWLFELKSGSCSGEEKRVARSRIGTHDTLVVNITNVNRQSWMVGT